MLPTGFGIQVVTRGGYGRWVYCKHTATKTGRLWPG